MVGFDIYCAAATCGLVSSVKTGGNIAGCPQDRDSPDTNNTNNLNISDRKTQTSPFSLRRIGLGEETVIEDVSMMISDIMADIISSISCLIIPNLSVYIQLSARSGFVIFFL